MRLNASARRNKPKARLNAYEALLAEDRNVKLDQVQIHIPAGPAARRRGRRGRRRCASHTATALLIDDLSFTLPRGGIVGVIGPNGAGKTTLLRMITGQEQPDDGRAADRRHRRARVRRSVARRAGPRQDRLGGDLGRRGPDHARRPDRQQPRVRRGLQLQGHRPAEEGRQAVRRRAQPAAPREAPAHRRQPAAARRADQRPRRRHAARARGGAALVRGLRRRRLPRSLVPGPDRDPRAGVRGRLPGALVRGQLRGLRELPPRAARRRGRPAAPDHVQEAGPRLDSRTWRLEGRPDHRLLLGDRPRHRRAARRATAGRSTRPRAARRRSTTSRPRAARRCALDVTDEAVDDAPRSSTVTEAEGAVGVLDQQRRLQPVGRRRDGPARPGPPPVRDQRVRADPDVPARAAGHARSALGQDRQPRLDGRPADVPGRRLYHATKYAVEALSDALRFEVRGFGVDVILIEPGLIVTNFGEVAAGLGRRDATGTGPYARLQPPRREGDRGGLRRAAGRSSAAGPRRSRRRSPRRSNADQPKARYPVTPSAHLMIDQRRLTPDRVWDLMMRTQFPTPKP